MFKQFFHKVSDLPHVNYHVLISARFDEIFSRDSLAFKSWKLLEFIEYKVAIVYFVSDVDVGAIAGYRISYQVNAGQSDLLEDVLLTK